VDADTWHVQAVGLNTQANKIDMHSDASGDGRRKYHKDSTCDTTYMANKLDVEKNWHMGKNWKKVNTPVAPAGNGKELMYGPFELS